MKKLLSSLLGVSLLFSSFPSHTALAVGNENSNDDTTIYVTAENIEEVWHKFFDENYAHYEVYFTEEGYEAFGETLVAKAEAEADMMTEEEVAELEQEVEEIEQEWQEFVDNLTPETFWEQYLIDNPDVLYMSNEEYERIKAEVLAFAEEMELPYEGTNSEVGISSFSGGAFDQVFMTGAVNSWTRIFSLAAGVPASSFAAIHNSGTTAARRATFSSFTGMREDAYRHWLWNAIAVRNTTAGSNATQRRDRTRIVTTYREIVTYIHRFNNSLRVMNPNTALIQRGIAVRNIFLNLNEGVWVGSSTWGVSHRAGGLNTPNGRSEQMDLWNNHWGRVDGLAGEPTTARFNQRWNNAGQNTGLVHSNGTGTRQMSLARQRHLFRQRWHRPRG